MAIIPLDESLDRWHEQDMEFAGYPRSSKTTVYSPEVDSISVDGVAQSFPHIQTKPTPFHAGQPPIPTSTTQYASTYLAYSRPSDTATDVPLLDTSDTLSLDISKAGQAGASVPTASSPLSDDKTCPLINGEVAVCQPSRCGSEAPCLSFVNFPPIEECTSVPCLKRPNNELDPDPSRLAQRAKRTSPSRTTMSRSSSSSSIQVSATQAQPKVRRRSDKTSTRSGKVMSKNEAKQRAKAAHSLVEKKYRENLNTKLISLNTTLQNAHYGPKRIENVDSDLQLEADLDRGPPTLTGRPNIQTSDGAREGTKFRKSDVLSDAMDYVNQTEVEMRHMENEIKRLNERVKGLEKLVNCEDCHLLQSVVGLHVEPI